MKKIKWIVIVLALIMILFIPIPSGVYKDGGTREYSALTYKIVDWNAMYTVYDSDVEPQIEIFDETKLYLFPKNFRDINALWDEEERKLKLLSNNVNQGSDETDDENSVNGDSNTANPQQNISGKDISYEVQYIRTNGYVEDADYPQPYIIWSREELNAYYESNKDTYDLERHETVYSDTTIGFLDACDKYTDEFFVGNYLIFVVLEEGSGSIRHEAKKVQLSEMDGDNIMGIFIETITPEAGTDDMAEWHIIFEISKEHQVGSADDILVYFDDEVEIKDKHSHEPAKTPQTVDNPMKGYCGNTITKIHIGDEKYCFWGDKSVNLTDILVNLDYKQEKLCRCMTEYKVDTEFGHGYEINLREGFVRYKQRQAELTQEQINEIANIIEWIFSGEWKFTNEVWVE